MFFKKKGAAVARAGSTIDMNTPEKVVNMINRGFAMRKNVVGFLVVAGWLIGSQSASAQESGKGAAAPPAPAALESEAEPTPDEIRQGQDLFEGRVRFANRGPSCNACHHVNNEAVIGGGILAVELTSAFSTLGKEVISGFVESSPSPVMQAAYEGKAVTEDEIRALAAFLQHVDKDQARQMPRDTGWRIFGAGVGGVVVLMGFFSLIGQGRKKRSVNQDIFDRQNKSE